MQSTRRQMIRSLAAGGLLLPGMLSELLCEQALGASDPLAPKMPHHPPRAKRVIFLYMTGGVSHVDSFDPKPELRRYHDQKVADPGFCKGADWNFHRYGRIWHGGERAFSRDGKHRRSDWFDPLDVDR